jgi:uncharacterized protein YndB with AHSA1/START domain
MKRILWIAFLLPVALSAEVTDSSPGGFTVKISFTVTAAPGAVYDAVMKPANWWSSGHTFSGDAHNLSIDAKPMGCFCEKLPNGGGVRHLEVVSVMPGKLLVMTGGLGPLQSQALSGSMSIGIAAAGDETKLSMTYAVAGYVPAGANTWAAPVNGMLSEQFTRLKNYIEHGTPETK